MSSEWAQASGLYPPPTPHPGYPELQAQLPAAEFLGLEKGKPMLGEGFFSPLQILTPVRKVGFALKRISGMYIVTRLGTLRQPRGHPRGGV